MSQESWLDEALNVAGISFDPALPYPAKLALLVKRLNKIPGTESGDYDADLDEAIDLLREWLAGVSGHFPDVSDVKTETIAFLKRFQR